MLFGRYVNKYYKKFWYLFLIGIIALILVDYFQLLIPDIIGDIVDNVKNKVLTTKMLERYVIELLIIALVMFLGRFSWRLTIFGLGLKIETDLRKNMFNKSLKLSQKYYQDNKTGAIMALYTNDLQAIRSSFGSGTIMVVDALFLGTLALVKMIKLNLLLSLVAAVPLFVIALCGGIIGKYMNMKFKLRQESYEKLSDFSQEAFSGFQVIKAFVLEGKELINYKRLNKNNIDKNMDFIKFAVLLEILIGILINSIFIIIALYGGYIVSISTVENELLSAGELTKFVSYFEHLIWPMMAIAQVINLRSQGNASLSRINELLDEKIDIVDVDTVVVDNLIGNIEFKDFNFSYPNSSDTLVLKDINLEIKAGELIGVIGKTGSGKTTLVDVLLRIYNVNENQVFIDGIDIMRIPFRKIRDIIGYVPQDGFLFSETIKENIAFSNDNYKEDEIISAADFSDVDENIREFKEGYNTILGERGSTISGGQKQRISIARAVIKDPKILILDDSVSAVDTKTEEKIINNLRNIRKNKTTILIAHRISSVKKLDKIVLLDEGRIIGFGTHEELLKSSKEYQDIVLLQKLEEGEE